MHIACILAEGFEDSEFAKPAQAFRNAGHGVTVIGERKGVDLKGKRGKEKVKTDLSIDQARPEEFQALFIPGGYSPDQLRADPRFVAFVRAFRDRPIFAICHGPQLLITADMVRGRTMTAWKTIQTDLKFAGANVVDREVVVDGTLITSRQPSDADAFIRESLDLLSLGAGAHA
jgi:protease I